MLENLVADFVELQSLGTITKKKLGTFEVAAKLHKIVILSEKMASNAGRAPDSPQVRVLTIILGYLWRRAGW